MTLPEVLACLEDHRVYLRILGDARLILAGTTADLPREVVSRVRDLRPAILELIGAAENRAVEPAHNAEGTLYLASYGQSRLAFLDRLDPLSAAYNVTASLAVTGRCETERIARAVTEVAKSHPASRTCLARVDDVDISVVTRGAALELPVCDLSGLPESSRSVELQALRDTVSRTRFNLERPPLISWILARLAPEHHELVVALHHYVCDGWSLVRSLRTVSELLTGENKRAVAACCNGRGSYPDYARWQRAECRTPATAAALKAWRERLEGFCRPIPFTFERRPEVTVGGSAGGRLTFSPDIELERHLRARAASLRCTVGTLLTGVFALALARTSGVDRFLIGMAVSDRPDKSFEETFGFFVNWLPLRIDFTRAPTLASFFADLQQERLRTLADTHIPFDQIVHAFGGERVANKNPLFQFMFVSHVPARGVRMGDLTATIAPLFSGSAKLDLTMFFTDARKALAIADGASGINLDIEYSSALFDAPTVERFAESFLEIAKEVVAADSTRVLAVRTPAKIDTTAHGVRIAHDRTPLLAIASATARTPEAPALQFEGETWSYRQLAAATARVAEDLARSGINKGDRVCTLQARGPAAIASMLGSMLAGAVFTPLDTSNPDARLASVLEQARPRVILSCNRLRARAQRLGGDVPVLAPTGLAENAMITWNRWLARLQEGDAAYLLFTSGSMGRPKGVLGGHAQLANFCNWLGRYLALTVQDVVACKTSLSFDASFRETVASLAAGARLELLNDDEAADTAALLRTLYRSRATVLHATPTLYRDLLLVLTKARHEDLSEGTLPALRAVMCGGESLDAGLATDHGRLLPSCVLHNVYGPTECTVDVTAQEVRVDKLAPVPIGRPIQNVSISILDDNLRPLPQGREGEIAIAGRAVGLGYWPKFTDTEEPGQRRFRPARQLGFDVDSDAYLTGDYGVLRPDGSILLRGRRDRQVQIGGLRVELDEIESALLGLGDVAQAAVLHRAERDSCHLIAFLELSPGTTPCTVDRWRAALLERLPAAMIPATIVLVERLPRLVNGKIDRRALEATPLAEPHSGALTPEAQAVLRLMQEFLGGESVSPTTSFFAQGGHSLNAVRLVARANREFGRSLTIKDFFADPTAIGFARRLVAAPESRALEFQVSRAPRPRRAPND